VLPANHPTVFVNNIAGITPVQHGYFIINHHFPHTAPYFKSKTTSIVNTKQWKFPAILQEISCQIIGNFLPPNAEINAT
jgi:hypothetical protein